MFGTFSSFINFDILEKLGDCDACLAPLLAPILRVHYILALLPIEVHYTYYM
jgi:hypothetical protein